MSDGGLFGGPKTPTEERYDKARQEVSSAVARLVSTEHGAGGFETRDLYPGAGAVWRGRHALPVPHIQAVRALRAAVSEEERRALDNARGAGLTWEEIADALGLAEAAKRFGQSPALAAWRYAAMRVMPGDPDPEWEWRYASSRGPTADWRCYTCAGSVHEGHPDGGVEAQEGHEAGCARYAAALAEQQARWDDEESTGSPEDGED